MTLLPDEFASAAAIDTHDELLKHMAYFSSRLGFQTITAFSVLDHPHRESEFSIIDHNMPAKYLTSTNYMSGGGRHDPVMQHCKRAGVPIIWNQNTYILAGRGERWETQAQFGLRTGIAVALHLPEGRHFCVGVDRHQALPSKPWKVAHMTAWLQFFAVLVQDAAQRVLLPSPPQPKVSALTPRELECLRWTMEGKTAWEVANILSISEQTAARHVNHATQKLGCVNKLQAVVKALRAGLIQ